jgi:hypothetical protein
MPTNFYRGGGTIGGTLPNKLMVVSDSVQIYPSRIKPKTLKMAVTVSSTRAEHLAVKITGLFDMTLKMKFPCQVKEPSLPKISCAKHGSKFAAPHRQW